MHSTTTSACSSPPCPAPPPFRRLIRSTLYPRLRDHPSVCRYPPVRGLALPGGHGVCFLDHDHPEGGGGEDRSKYNTWEAEFVVALARHMLLQGYAPGGWGAGRGWGRGAGGVSRMMQCRCAAEAVWHGRFTCHCVYCLPRYRIQY